MIKSNKGKILANETYKLVDTSAEQGDLGLAIQNLIIDNLKALNTCFLAEIVAIKENKVSVRQVVKSDGKEADLIVNNCLVGFAFGGDWQTQFKLKTGDIGLCVVANKDISTYKQSGVACVAPTKRFKNVNDSIFLPLSLYKTLPIESVDFTIKGKDDEITFKSGELTLQASQSIKAKGTSEITLESPMTTIQSPVITLGGNVSLGGALSAGASPMSAGNDSGTLGACFDAVFSALDLIASGMKGSSTNPNDYLNGKSALQAQIKAVVQ